MAYMIVIGSCYGCRRVFQFNADHVPAVVINGEREPICRECVERANPRRIANGLPPIEILPDAYEAQEVI